MLNRTTIMAHEELLERVNKHLKKNPKGNLSDFYNRAIVNQLEKEGDFEIRDLIEELEQKEAEE